MSKGFSQIVKHSTLLKGERSWIIVEEVEQYITSDSKVVEEKVGSNLGSSLLDLGLDCGLAGAGYFVAGGFAYTGVGIGAAVSVSTLVTATSGASCIISAGKVVNEIIYPGLNQELEKDLQWLAAIGVLEAISLGSAVKNGIKSLKTLNRTNTQLKTYYGKSLGFAISSRKTIYSGKIKTLKKFINGINESGGKYRYLNKTGKLPTKYVKKEKNKHIYSNLLEAVDASLNIVTSDITNGDLFNKTKKAYVIHLLNDK